VFVTVVDNEIPESIDAFAKSSFAGAAAKEQQVAATTQEMDRKTLQVRIINSFVSKFV
jgi:hypothetical protein